MRIELNNMTENQSLTGWWGWLDGGPIVPGRDGRVAAIAADQTALVDIGVAIDDQVSNRVKFARIQVAQFAIVSSRMVAISRLTISTHRF